MLKKYYNMYFLLIGILALLYIVPMFVSFPYKMALIFVIGKYLFFVYLAILLLKASIIDLRNNPQEKTLFHRGVLLSASLLGGIILVLNVAMIGSLIKPIHWTAITSSSEIKKNAIYVTTNSECVYCKVSYENMLRASQVYGSLTSKPVYVIDLKTNTPLSKALNKRVDHYGSVLMVDNKNIQREATYTLSKEDGEPVQNTSSNIYHIIQEVNE